jgi:hypothetical protein
MRKLTIAMKPKGIYKKYIVQKADGTPIDKNADYFPLRLDTDRHARSAAKAYAESVKVENPQLYEDLMQKVKKYTKSNE